MSDELEATRALIDRWGWNATAYQILNPGIARWFSARGDAVVGYVTHGRYRIVAGSPICDLARLAAVIEEFETDSRRLGRFTCYFAADERLARHLERRGPLDRILLGAQPVWDPAVWPDILKSKASLRAQLNRATNKKVQVLRWKSEAAADHEELHRCLEEWLETRGLPALHFLVEPETLGRIYDRRVYVAEQIFDKRGDDKRGDDKHGDDKRSEVVGFLVASPVPQRNGWLIEQFVRGHGAPNGTTELMLDAAFRDLAELGASYVTLGLSPLSRRADVQAPPQPLWIRLLLGWIRAHGRRFYNFDGLDAFKAKFLPQTWEPIYAITSERRVGLGTLWAISGAFGKMSPPKLMVLAVLRGAAKELHWLRRRFTRP